MLPVTSVGPICTCRFRTERERCAEELLQLGIRIRENPLIWACVAGGARQRRSSPSQNEKNGTEHNVS